jgi:hypothetical protein
MGGALFALASLQISRNLPQGSGRMVIPMLAVIGISTILIAILSMASKPMAFRFELILQRPSTWLGISTWRFALVMMGFLFSILVHYAAGELVLMNSPLIAWAAWLLSIGLVIGGAWQFGGLGLASRQNILLTGVGLSVLAYLFRGFTPEYYPIIFSGDEASSGNVGVNILTGTFNNPFTMGWFSFPGLYFFIPAGSIMIFGQTVSALRIPSIIAGALTVGFTYVTARAMYGRLTGLLAALLLVGFQVHINFSRMGLSNIWDGLFFITVIGAAWYAWERENRNSFLLAGFGLGLSQYFYVTSHALLILIPVWLIIVSLFDREKFKRLLPGILFMAMSAFVVVLPLAWFYAHHPLEFLAPMSRVGAPGPLLESLWLGAQSFTHLPLWGWWYLSNTPFLGTPVAELFLMGVVYLFIKLRESRNILMALWLILFVFIGGFSIEVPSPQRYVAVMPACMIVAALSLTRLTGVLEKARPKIISYFRTLLVLLVLYISIKDAVYYYTDYTQFTRYYLSETNGMVAQQLGKFLQTQPQDTQVVFFGEPRMGYYSIPSTQFLAPKITGVDMLAPWGSPTNPQPDSAHLVFVFLPENKDEIARVQADFPGGELLEERTHWQKVLYYYYVFGE